MATEAGSVQVRVTPDTSKFAEKLKDDLRAISAQISDLDVEIAPKLSDKAVQEVRDKLTRLTQARTASIKAGADTRTATAELDRLARDRTVNINTRVNGSGLGSLGSSANSSSGALKALISLAPAAAPIVASLGASLLSIAAGAGAASVGLAAFGAALAPQIKSFMNLSEAMGELDFATKTYGSGAAQTVQAQQAVTRTMAGMSPVTRQAAGAFLVLKDDFTSWSDSLAGFTLKPVTQGMADIDGLLPHLTPLVKGVSDQLSRLTTIAGGEINSPGFDALMKRFSAFTDGVLDKAVDGIIHFSRALGEGSFDGPVQSFMTYAAEVGPQVKETFKNLASALSTVAQGAADAGPGMLSLVNAALKLVAALPPRVVATLLQVYSAMKLISLTSGGIGTAATAVQGLSRKFVELRATADRAGGGMAGIKAAFASLGTAAKASVVIAALAGIALAVTKLSNLGKSAPPNIDRLTTSLGELGANGKVTGEAARVFGTNLGKLHESLAALADPSLADNIQQGVIKVVSLGFADSTPVKRAKEDFDALDKSLANLVQNGHAPEAAAAVQELRDKWVQGGGDVTKFNAQLDDYKSALDDAAFEAELTAKSQGLFGKQAQDVQKKLDAQKASADGLRQSLQALNDVNRSALDAQSDLEAAIDTASSAIKDNGKALHYRNGELDLGSEKARNEYSALSDLAGKTDAATAAARDNGESWDTVNRIYDQGRSKLIENAQKMGLNRDEANKLADAILKIPASHQTDLRAKIDDLQTKIDAAKAKLKTVPKSQQASVKANISQLESQLKKARHDLDSINGKTSTTYVNTVYRSSGLHGHLSTAADGALTRGNVRKMADGGNGRPAMMAKGGSSILWAEAGDEAYIPLDRRPRSMAIASEAVAAMGGTVDWKSGTGTGTAVAAAGGSGGGSAGTAPQQLVLQVGGSDQAFLAWLRQAVKQAGGNVQVALGQAGR